MAYARPRLLLAVALLTAVRYVNRTDALTLLRTFGSLERVAQCSVEELLLCPGLGDRKARSLYNTFHANVADLAAAADPTK